LLRNAFFILAAALAATAWAQPVEKSAAQLFQRYTALSRAYDAELVQLFDDHAVITNKRIYPNGEVRETTLPAAQYKALLRKALPLAQQRGDRSTYSNVRYAREGERVRISASRYSELKKYASPLVLVVGPAPGGRWVIYEEHSESRP
jgi:hypothetical protein